MVIPQTRALGGLLILASFAFILTQIRLGLLCEMMIVCCLLFIHPGSIVDSALAAWLPAGAAAQAPVLEYSLAGRALAAALWTYLVLRPLVYFGQSYNYFRQRRIPGPVQWALERYANAFGIILWRVFTVDVINFTVEMRSSSRPPDSTSVAAYDSPLDFRFNHVGEAIAVATIFTTLKYFPNQPELFRERLLRYARTLQRSLDGDPVFRYVSIDKASPRFRYIPIVEYRVELADGRIETRSLADTPPDAAVKAKVAYEGSKPGTYAPLR
jgi:hypothetical protein